VTAIPSTPSRQPLLPLHSPAPNQTTTPVINPTTATNQAANTNPPTTFFSFFIHHVRTDPQARLCTISISNRFTTPAQCYSLFVGLLFVIFLTFVVRVILSPTLSMLFVFATYSSIWLPQIVRSVRRGRGSGFSKGYVFGTTICRLFNCLCTYPLPSRFGFADTFFRFPGMPQKCP
jgi:transmembrane E3 ubiquitin-protein ligase